METDALLCKANESLMAVRNILTASCNAPASRCFGNAIIGLAALALFFGTNGCKSKSVFVAPPHVQFVPYKTTLNHSLIDAAWRDNEADLDSALKQGADVDAVDIHRDTALNYAGMHGNLAIAKILITHGADVNHLGYLGGTPLMGALSNGDSTPHSQLKMVNFLITHGAEVNAKDGEKRTALFYACAFYCHKPDTSAVVRLLVKHGATIHYKDLHGISPIQEAKKRGYLDLVPLLIQLDNKQHRAYDRQESDQYTATGRLAEPADRDCAKFPLSSKGRNTFVYVAMDAIDANGQLLEAYRQLPHGFYHIRNLGFSPYGEFRGIVESPNGHLLFEQYQTDRTDPDSQTGYIEYYILPDGKLKAWPGKWYGWFGGKGTGPGLFFDSTGNFAYMISPSGGTVLSFRVKPDGRFVPLVGPPVACGPTYGGFLSTGTLVYLNDREGRLWQYRIDADGRLRACDPAYLTLGAELEPMGITSMPNGRAVYVSGYLRTGSMYPPGRIYQFRATNKGLRSILPSFVDVPGPFGGIESAPDSRHLYVLGERGFRVFSVAATGAITPTSVYLHGISGMTHDDRTRIAYAVTEPGNKLQCFIEGADGGLRRIVGVEATQDGRVRDIIIIHR